MKLLIMIDDVYYESEHLARLKVALARNENVSLREFKI